MSLFWRVKPSEILANSVGSYFGVEAIPIDVHTKQSAAIRSGGYVPVLLIYFLRNVTKVTNPIVPLVSIDVVKLLSRPFAKNVEPSKAMRPVLATKDPKADVAPIIKSTHQVADVASVRARDSSEEPRFYVIVKRRLKTFAGKIISSHEAPIQLIGQRPASVSALSGLCYGIAS